MPARQVTTARQVRLAVELRKLREKAGLSVQEAARALGIAQTKLSNTEAARVGVSPDRVRHFACQYTCDDGALIDALALMAAERERGWWEEYRGTLPDVFLDLAELEQHATYLSTFETVHIPGLLQTEEQIRAIYARSVPELPSGELEVRVHYRLRRQDILRAEAAKPYDVVIHEAALRIRAADRAVAKRQLVHILALSEHPHVNLRVVPFDIDGFAGIGYSLLYVGGPVPQLDTVHLDADHGAAISHAELQLKRYQGLLRRVRSMALEEKASRDFIQALLRDV